MEKLEKDLEELGVDVRLHLLSSNQLFFGIDLSFVYSFLYSNSIFESLPTRGSKDVNEVMVISDLDEANASL